MRCNDQLIDSKVITKSILVIFQTNLPVNPWFKHLGWEHLQPLVVLSESEPEYLWVLDGQNKQFEKVTLAFKKFCDILQTKQLWAAIKWESYKQITR